MRVGAEDVVDADEAFDGLAAAKREPSSTSGLSNKYRNSRKARVSLLNRLSKRTARGDKRAI